jgi:(S)-ureidoglycine aminohydrolase
MKIFLAAIALLVTFVATAQSDTIPYGVYPIKGGNMAPATADLALFKTHASTLAPGKTNHRPRALNDADELIFVQDGLLKVTINDSTKTVGPGSIILIMAGDTQNFENTSTNPATYYVMTFKSRSGINLQRGKDAGGSLIIDWNKLAVKKTEKGESRPIFDRPTAMFSKLEVHATALNSGLDSHPPHTHRAEEIMLLMKGNVTAHIGGKDYPVNPGDMMLATRDIIHNVTNTGAGQCWYYAIKWYN